MKRIVIALVVLLFAGVASAAEHKVQLKDLSPAVQQTISEQSKGAEIKSIIKEVENGMTQYEVETMLNGKHRDFNVDSKGKLLEVEEETSIDAIPGAAKAAIEKKTAGAKLGMVESIKRGDKTLYEAAYTSKTGKKHEIAVNPDGSEARN